jgi:cytoskeletal protein RodZ
VKKFKIPSKLNEIQKISDPEVRFQELLDLAKIMDIALDNMDEEQEDLMDESTVTKEVRKAHKEFVSNFSAAVGFALILLSGIWSVVRSFSPPAP